MSKHHTHRPAGRAYARTGNRRFRPSTLAVSLALLLAAPAYAQEAATGQADEAVTELDQVTVTGIRGSLQRAQDIKRDANTFVDSVTALDIGALPDRSITETLSRIPGVTIDRFLAVGDPEHFSAEGNGVQVRGMTQVRSELNGRDSFSASGGRGLSFQDVPSELMAGVDVYKNQTARMIEGGLGGTVDLRTRMPLDFDGEKLAASFSVNRGDFARKVDPSASVLYSNRWAVGDGGDFGLLVDLARSDLSTRTDGLFVRPFFKNSNSDITNDGVNEELWLPRGADWRTLNYDRERSGAYVAMQWRPNDSIEVSATAFQSSYKELWYEDAIFVSNDPLQVRVDASQPHQFDGNVFRSGRLTQDGGVPMGTDIRGSDRDSTTTDYSIGLKWQFSDATTFRTDLQYIKADTQKLDSTVSLGVNVPYIDVTLGGVPSIGINEQFTRDPANYYWGFTMENVVDNEADQVAWRADVEHRLDGGFFKGINAGVRLTDRDATSRDTSYHWAAVFQTWMRGWQLPADGMPPLDLNGTVNSSLVNLQTFQNFYRGGANTPGAFYAPVLATALGFPDSYKAIHDAAAPFYLCCGAPFEPRDLEDPEWTNIQSETTRAAYLMADFGIDAVRIDGNFGVRVVRTENSASGYVVFPNELFAPYLGAGESEPVNAENSYTDVLPSLNVRWELADDLLVRFAASKAIARPDFGDMQAFQILEASPRDGVQEPTDGSTLPVTDLDLTGSSYDNPYLEPMKANQYDLSLEWYFDPDRGGMAWVNLFHKDIKDYFRRQSQLLPFPGADGNTYDYLITRPVNVGTARITGAEVGWNQFFTFLPAPFDGLGMSANFTYIDSSTRIPKDPTVIPTDTDGSTMGDLPADGLSERAYNVAAFYEKGPWQVRLAYNWRSEYLLAVGANGYNGGDGGIAWKLPVYSDDYGQLDGSLFYRISDNVQIGLEMNNLNNAEQRTIMQQNDAGRHVTSWFVNDRRYAATIRLTF